MFIYRFPWLYLGLVFLAYGVFGWIVAKSMNLWIAQFREVIAYWGLSLSPMTAKLLIYSLISLVIFVIILILTIPVKSFKFLFGSWLKSDNQAMVSLLFWSFVLVLVICFLENFIRFLVLFSSNILGRLKLQELDYKGYQIILILITVSFLGFTTGYFSFIHRL